MKTAAVIPARYESTRLPGKLLLNKTGKYLIQHVYENVSYCDRIDEVYVATASDRIAEAVREFGGSVIRTGTHDSGTSRICEAASDIEAEYIINVQGDEPAVGCNELHALIDLMEEGWKMGTLVSEITSEKVFFDPNQVKVVMGEEGRALYFSRAPVPWYRDRFDGEDLKVARGEERRGDQEDEEIEGFHHIGMYGFQRSFLREWNDLPDGNLEKIEQLEQLRALENGVDIGVRVVETQPFGVDTEEDYEAFLNFVEDYPQKSQ